MPMIPMGPIGQGRIFSDHVRRDDLPEPSAEECEKIIQAIQQGTFTFGPSFPQMTPEKHARAMVFRKDGQWYAKTLAFRYVPIGTNDV